MISSGYYNNNKYKIEYPSLRSSIHPVRRSVEITVLVFAGLPSFGEKEYGEELSDTND